MFKALVSLLCVGGSIWLIYTFGFGMLVAVGAAAAAALLLTGAELKGPEAVTRPPLENHRTTQRADF
jgi:hypothetical protein